MPKSESYHVNLAFATNGAEEPPSGSLRVDDRGGIGSKIGRKEKNRNFLTQRSGPEKWGSARNGATNATFFCRPWGMPSGWAMSGGFQNWLMSTGEGSFLLPYTIMLILAGLPLFFMELALGQYSGAGPTRLFGRLSPAMKGLGFSMLTATFFVAIYYNVIIAWTIYYTFAGFTSGTLPWVECGPRLQHVSMHRRKPNDDRIVAPRGLLQRRHVGLHPRKTRLEQFRGYSMAFSRLFVGRLDHRLRESDQRGVFEWKSGLFHRNLPIRGVGHLVYTGFDVGGRDGRDRILRDPQHDQSWRTPKCGKTRQTRFSTAWVRPSEVWSPWPPTTSSTTIVTETRVWSLFATAPLRFSRDSWSSPFWGSWPTPRVLDIEDVVEGGPALAFVAFPDAIGKMSWCPQLWSFLFFAMLITLGLDSMFTFIETLTTALLDHFERLRPHKEMVVVGTCLTGLHFRFEHVHF